MHPQQGLFAVVQPVLMRVDGTFLLPVHQIVLLFVGLYRLLNGQYQLLHNSFFEVSHVVNEPDILMVGQLALEFLQSVRLVSVIGDNLTFVLQLQTESLDVQQSHLRVASCEQLVVEKVGHLLHVVLLHKVLPYAKVLVQLVVAEEVYRLQLVVHVLFGYPLIPSQKMSVLLDELSDALTADSHVLVLVAFVELHDAVVVRVGVLVQVEEVQVHVGMALKETEDVAGRQVHHQLLVESLLLVEVPLLLGQGASLLGQLAMLNWMHRLFRCYDGCSLGGFLRFTVPLLFFKNQLSPQYGHGPLLRSLLPMRIGVNLWN